MSIFSITLNENTKKGKALLSYLKAIGIIVQEVPKTDKSKYVSSQADKRKGRVEKFDTPDELFNFLNI
ncbi:MAG: hypothetical protein J6Y82_06390 [Bacteroidales bacterium]|nr:hypothetical protein [Bacteroidales bacterium]